MYAVFSVKPCTNRKNGLSIPQALFRFGTSTRELSAAEQVVWADVTSDGEVPWSVVRKVRETLKAAGVSRLFMK